MQKMTRFLVGALLLSSPLMAQTVMPVEPITTPTPLTVTPLAPLTTPAPGAVVQGDIQYNEKRSPEADDMEALRRWIRDKRLVTLKEIGGDLSISGEVRTEFQDTSEAKKGKQQRGVEIPDPNSPGKKIEKAQYAWDSEVNIMLDYRTDRTWAAIKVEFDNDMGLRSGTVNRIRLEKGYLGGRIIPGDTFTLDGEIGRRYLYNVFDSRVEFSALFDGCLIRMNKAWPSLGDYYFNVGALLVDDKVNHYAYVCEMGGLRIANVGLNIKYSLIDWYKPYANELNNLRFKFLVSQLNVAYQFYPEWIGKKLVKFYAAGLMNHLAHGVPQTNNTMQRCAWYAGLSLGLVRKQYDWAIDANYQWVQAQSIPEFDVSGIGRGNTAGVGFYANNTNGDPASGATTNKTAVGNTNYKGFEIEALYAFTDNITILQNFKYSQTLNREIGPGSMYYKQYELEFIYAF